MQKPADTRLAPALTIELNDLEAGLRPLGITVVVEQRELLGRGPRKLMPEPFDRVVTEAVFQFIIDIIVNNSDRSKSSGTLFISALFSC